MQTLSNGVTVEVPFLLGRKGDIVNIAVPLPNAEGGTEDGNALNCYEQREQVAVLHRLHNNKSCISFLLSCLSWSCCNSGPCLSIATSSVPLLFLL